MARNFHDKILDNDYNTSNYEYDPNFSLVLTEEIGGDYLNETRNQEEYTYRVSLVGEIMTIVEESKYVEYLEALRKKETKKNKSERKDIEKLGNIFYLVNKILSKNSFHQKRDVLSAFGYIFDVESKTLWKNLCQKNQEEILAEANRDFKILEKKNIKKLF